MKLNVFVFDIDGTIADLTHRLRYIETDPKDWDSFFAACINDRPIEHMRSLMVNLKAAKVCVSGRSEQVRKDTIAWMQGHDFPPIEALYMRTQGDHRPDHIVKLELLAKIRADGFEPIMAFDDRNQVVDMWRAAGIPCAQVAPGDF